MRVAILGNPYLCGDEEIRPSDLSLTFLKDIFNCLANDLLVLVKPGSVKMAIAQIDNSIHNRILVKELESAETHHWHAEAIV